MAHDPAEARISGGASTQRLRVGAIGLACVFLLVMLAAAFLRTAGDYHAAGNSAASLNATEPSEPLAQLGVAPGNAEPAPPPAVAKTPSRR